eukprot:TRINITY_DN1322_c0_g1_i1.p1 TRINITY_DN1322_c0_g1~~TRINITY_DN1322_c0_g1_i1.p1  ORF type:complete len:195 (-),score=47.75 TRINITY_DN1322_c0_g1_i1:318-902(-)
MCIRDRVSTQSTGSFSSCDHNFMEAFTSSIGWVLAGLVPSSISSFITKKNIPEWYEHLKKPSFNPPNKIFGPVWITLYITSGYAISRVCPLGEFISGFPSSFSLDSPKQLAVYSFSLQLILNHLWTPLFFGIRRTEFGGPLAGLIATILGFTVYQTSKVDTTATLLLSPLLAWTSFASFLSFTIDRLNRPPKKE